MTWEAQVPPARSAGDTPPRAMCWANLHSTRAFQAVWRERQRGSDADADKAEQRFKTRLYTYRAGRLAPPAEWRRPGSRLAEVLGL